jgi:periplasmic copper chaperone A
MSTKKRSILLVGAAAALSFAIAAGPASAHVTVSSTDAVPGGYGKVVVRVPSESETASTTRVQVTMPADTPFASVRTKAHPGWRVRVDEAKLPEPVQVGDLTLTDAVRSITWTADPGQGIKPNMFDEFELSIGPFPEQPTTLTFPAVQTYSDGEVVRWTQPTPPGGAEPEHPAPVLELTADGTATGHDDTRGEEDVAVTVSDDTTDVAASDDDSDALARTVAIGGFVVGLIALGASILRRRSAGGD